jgi:membrane-associated phospholipid phosphatase
MIGERNERAMHRGGRAMYSAILLAALGTAADVPAQSYQAPIGNGGRAGFYLVPRLLAPEPAAPAVPVLPAREPDLVLRWNEAALLAVKEDGTPPPLAARNLAMMHAAVYDAVNAVYRTHRPYLVDAHPPPGTSAEAAAAIAAHRTLVQLYPKQVAHFNALLDDSFRQIPDVPGKADGVALGQFTAESVLGWRENDGAQRTVAYAPRGGPGLWRPTPPAFKPALLPQWPSLTCFAMRSGSQFRPTPPPALTSAAYTAAYEEVRSLGGVHSLARTPEQTEIARFWADGDGTVTPPGHWNRIAQAVALARGTTLAENARLFALLNLALADAGVVAWDCKFHYDYWRPIQAIREAASTGNPDTPPDPDWAPLLPTPPFPTYTSGHSTFSSAAAGVLAVYFGRDDVPFTSTSEGLPGVTRSFAGFWAAAEEAGQSRIYGGIHWQFDNTEGLASGRALGRYVAERFLTPRGGTDVPAAVLLPTRRNRPASVDATGSLAVRGERP